MKILKAAPLAAILAMPLPAVAGEADDLRALREEVARLRETYEKRIDALERRLVQAERAADKTESAAIPPPVAVPAKSVGANAFNPEISLILAGTWTRQSQSPTSYQETPDPRNYHLHGFVAPLGEIEPPRRGFGLGESELRLSANIDPFWRGVFTAALPAAGGGAEVEEAFVQSLGLGHGLTLKAGRHLSGIGYMNEQHAHTWDFADAPLAYKAFLANQLRNDGVQLKWLAPTELFLELGAEAAGGGAFPASNGDKNGTTLGTLFAHAGGDVGLSQSWRAGLSALATGPRDRGWNDVDRNGTAIANSFSGKSRLWLADIVWKWAPNGNSTAQSFTFQSEVFRRRESGSVTYDVAGAGGTAPGPLVGAYSSAQSGWYAQGVYKFHPHWRFGYRYDRLNSGTQSLALVDGGVVTAADLPLLSPYRPTRHTVMLDYATSEFARFRLQLARDDSRYDFANGHALRDKQIWLQYVVSLGAHGAHKY